MKLTSAGFIRFTQLEIEAIAKALAKLIKRNREVEQFDLREDIESAPVRLLTALVRSDKEIHLNLWRTLSMACGLDLDFNKRSRYWRGLNYAEVDTVRAYSWRITIEWILNGYGINTRELGIPSSRDLVREAVPLLKKAEQAETAKTQKRRGNAKSDSAKIKEMLMTEDGKKIQKLVVENERLKRQIARMHTEHQKEIERVLKEAMDSFEKRMFAFMEDQKFDPDAMRQVWMIEKENIRLMRQNRYMKNHHNRGIGKVLQIAGVTVTAKPIAEMI